MPYLRAFARDHRVLHMGPGLEERLGISVDRAMALRPTVVADLDRPPYPFRESTFDAAYAFSVLEHLTDLFAVLGELHRVLRPGGFIALLTPHFSCSSSFVDPSHTLHLSAQSFDYVIEGTELHRSFGFYSHARYRLGRRLLMLEAPWHYMPGVQSFVNRHVAFYERHLCYLVRGNGLYFELEVVK